MKKMIVTIISANLVTNSLLSPFLYFNRNHQIFINLLNDQVDSFETTPVEFQLKSLDGKILKKERFYSKMLF